MTLRMRTVDRQHCWPLQTCLSQWRRRQRSTAQAGRSHISSTLKSLDDLLGSRDESTSVEPKARQRQQQWQPAVLKVPDWAWREMREPRVTPAASNVLYYLILAVYSCYYIVQLVSGQEVADDLLARLSNDHAAVAAGDTVRLFTSFFVAYNIPQLLIALTTLATVAAELESLFGYSTFWAVWCITVLTGSLADAALSGLPITAGPAPGVAGVAAALLAHHCHNWRVEQAVAQAKTGKVPKPMLELENQYNNQLECQPQAHSSSERSTTSMPSEHQGLEVEQWQQQQDIQEQHSMPREQQGLEVGRRQQLQQEQRQQQPDMQQEHSRHSVSLDSASLDDGAEVESELDGPVGLPIKLLLPREGKAFATLGGVAIAVVSALKDAADVDVATDWVALAAGFTSGGVLGWLACPVYTIELVPVNSSSSATGVSPSDDMARNESSSGQSAKQGPDILLPVFKDLRPLPERANAVVGAAAALFAAVGAWLASQGALVN